LPSLAEAHGERHGLRADPRLRDAPLRAHHEREPIVALLLAPRLHAGMLDDLLAVVGGEHLGARGGRRGESQRGDGHHEGTHVGHALTIRLAMPWLGPP